MLGKVLSIPIISLLVHGSLCAQNIQSNDEKENKVSLELEGMAGFSFGNKLVAMNVGGPSLMLSVSRNLRIGVGAFPSFFVYKEKTGARLGVGNRFEFTNWVLFTSFFHFDTRDIWVGSAGFGYRFHKKKH
jgi:hypothetical protein